MSQKDGGGNPIWPKAPADDHTIPFFATSHEPNFSDPNDPEFKTGGSTGTGADNQTIAIATAATQWAYFGCYLDVNDPGNVVNGTPIWQAFPGTHHCLAAEIAFAGTPIEIGTGQEFNVVVRRTNKRLRPGAPPPPLPGPQITASDKARGG